jgi:hypothetical protein
MAGPAETTPGRFHPEDGTRPSPTSATPDRLGIAHNRAGRPGAWTIKFEPLFDSDHPRWIEHPVLGPRADIVALPLTELDDVDLLPYDSTNPGPEMPLGPATSLSIVGFPFGITAGGAFGIWITGAVASEPELDWNGLPVFLVDARTRPGQSGSPVITYSAAGTMPIQGGFAFGAGPSWRFHGVYSGRIRSDSDLGMVWKTRAVAELLDAVG